MKGIGLREYIKKIYGIIVRPAVLIPLSVAVYAAVLFILYMERTESWYSYVLYLLSAAILFLDVKILGTFLYHGVRGVMMKVTFTRRLLTDFEFKQQVSFFVSIFINLIFIAIHLIPGIFRRSLWLFAIGTYYLVLFLTRFSLFRSVSTANYGDDLKTEYVRYRRCGLILLALDVTLGVIITLIMIRGVGYTYSYYMCFVMAAYVFYFFIYALVQLIRFRRYHSPVLSAVRAVSFVSALLSVLSLETGLLSQFGDIHDDSSQTIIAVTGLVIVLFVAGVSFFMLIRGTKALRRGQASLWNA